ncbi:polymorphic toxin type 17 domain-containing protein [Kitasatospora aburaviensis]
MVITTDTALTKPVVLDFDEFGIPQDGQANVRYGWLGGKQRSAEAQDGDILMGARLYSPALGRFLQIDPMPGGNASPYDYCTGDPVNCTDLDGNWGMPKWLKKTVQVVAVVAEVASMIPGPIGAVAAAVSSVSYAATGNWAKAAEMAVTAVAQTVGAGPVVKVAAAVAAKSTRAAARVQRVASVARNLFRSCNSFDPETPVLMADGSYRPISAVTVGDRVAAADPDTGETVSAPVVEVFVTFATKHMVKIDTDLDPSTPGIRATAYHPVFVEERGWIDAGAVRIGDHLIGSDGASAEVLVIEDEGEVADQLVYNLNVGDAHTYFVAAGIGDALVHNTSAVCPITKKAAIKAAGLPTRGKIRYVPPGHWQPHQPLPTGRVNGQKGILDRHGNAWTKGPSRTKGEPYEWDVQLKRHRKYFGKMVNHLNVSLKGKITHITKK